MNLSDRKKKNGTRMGIFHYKKEKKLRCENDDDGREALRNTMEELTVSDLLWTLYEAVYESRCSEDSK